MKIWATVKGLSFRTTHRFPDAGSLESESAKTLQYPHTHRMYVNVFISQNHANRDVEYVTLEEQLETIIEELKMKNNEIGTLSCEDMGLFIYNKLKHFMIYEDRDIIVEVLEDNWNGARVGDD
jgi:hypothetical protein